MQPYPTLATAPDRTTPDLTASLCDNDDGALPHLSHHTRPNRTAPNLKKRTAAGGLGSGWIGGATGGGSFRLYARSMLALSGCGEPCQEEFRTFSYFSLTRYRQCYMVVIDKLGWRAARDREKRQWKRPLTTDSGLENGPMHISSSTALMALTKLALLSTLTILVMNWIVAGRLASAVSLPARSGRNELARASARNGSKRR